MASAHIYTANNQSDQSLAAGVAKCILQIGTPATRRAWIKEIAVGFRSITQTDTPVLVQLRRQSNAGTGGVSISSANVAPDVEGHPASLCTLLEGTWATTEPTSGVIVKTWEITPIGGQLVYQLPLGDEIEMAVSSFLGIQLTAAQVQACRAYIKFNE